MCRTSLGAQMDQFHLARKDQTRKYVGIGVKAEDWKILKVINRGAYSIVFLVVDELCRFLAMKMECAAAAELGKIFDEILIDSTGHPNFVDRYGFAFLPTLDPVRPFTVVHFMEYVPMTLVDKIISLRNAEPLQRVREAVSMTHQVLVGIDHMHGKG